MTVVVSKQQTSSTKTPEKKKYCQSALHFRKTSSDSSLSDIQTDTWTYRQTNKQTDTDRQTDTHRHLRQLAFTDLCRQLCKGGPKIIVHFTSIIVILNLDRFDWVLHCLNHRRILHVTTANCCTSISMERIKRGKRVASSTLAVINDMEHCEQHQLIWLSTWLIKMCIDR